MCIACGGICGGVGDVLLPSMVAGAGLVVLGVRARRQRESDEVDEVQSPDASGELRGDTEHEESRRD